MCLHFLWYIKVSIQIPFKSSSPLYKENDLTRLIVLTLFSFSDLMQLGKFFFFLPFFSAAQAHIDLYSFSLRAFHVSSQFSRDGKRLKVLRNDDCESFDILIAQNY